MARIVSRPEAQADILELWDYIAASSGDTRADQFIDRIRGAMNTLAENPGIGRPRDELRDGLRSHPVGRYLIFYSPIPNGVEIVRVVYGGRDLPAVFED